jgi:hypothetical protein
MLLYIRKYMKYFKLSNIRAKQKKRLPLAEQALFL